MIKLLFDIDTMLLSSVINPYPTYSSIKTQLTLYNWFITHCKDQGKIKQFRDLVCENVIVSAIINSREYKLNREDSYNIFSQPINSVNYRQK